MLVKPMPYSISRKSSKAVKGLGMSPDKYIHFPVKKYLFISAILGSPLAYRARQLKKTINNGCNKM